MTFESSWQSPLHFSHDFDSTKLVQVEFLNPLSNVIDFRGWLGHRYIRSFEVKDCEFRINCDIGILGWNVSMNLTFRDDKS